MAQGPLRFSTIGKPILRTLEILKIFGFFDLPYGQGQGQGHGHGQGPKESPATVSFKWRDCIGKGHGTMLRLGLPHARDTLPCLG